MAASAVSTPTPVAATPRSTRKVNGRSCTCHRIRTRLFTHEDPIHLHKTLGILALLSFFYRYCIVLPTTGTLGFNGSVFDWGTMVLHMALSSSSLIFHVLKKRMMARPMMIYEEYRQHAIVFSLRCFSVFAFDQLCPASVPDHIRRISQCCLVLGHHLVVDDITRRHGNPKQTTVRVDNSSTPRTKLVLRGYSFYQFLALASHLLPNARSSDLAFNALIAIQSSAFMMTLYRKSLVTQVTHGIVYSTCLLVSAGYILSQFSMPAFVLGVAAAFLLRCTFRLDKYALWAGFSILASPSLTTTLTTRLAALRTPAWLARLADLRTTVGGLYPAAGSSLGDLGNNLGNLVDLQRLRQHMHMDIDLAGLQAQLSQTVNLQRMQDSIANNVNMEVVHRLAATSAQHKMSATALACLLIGLALYWAISSRANKQHTAAAATVAALPAPRDRAASGASAASNMSDADVGDNTKKTQ